MYICMYINIYVIYVYTSDFIKVSHQKKKNHGGLSGDKLPRKNTSESVGREGMTVYLNRHFSCVILGKVQTIRCQA